MLCILTSKQVLCMLFTGQNDLFSILTSFPSQMGKKKRKRKKVEKYMKNNKSGLPAFRCYS